MKNSLFTKDKLDHFKKQSSNRLLRFIFIFFLPVILVFSSIYLVQYTYYFSAFAIWLIYPMSFLFLTGSIKTRILNVLPLLVLLFYIMISVETKDADKASLIFFAVPILSLLLKPKKHWIQYTTLGISIIYLILNHFTLIDFPFAVKWGLILVIYLVFIPPLVKQKIVQLFHKKPKDNQEDPSTNNKTL